jgi:hypothetical protein
MRCPSPCEAILAGVVLVIASAATPSQTNKAAVPASDNRRAEQPGEVGEVGVTKGPLTVRTTHRASTGSLLWLARQQRQDGSWDFRDGVGRDKMQIPAGGNREPARPAWPCFPSWPRE